MKLNIDKSTDDMKAELAKYGYNVTHHVNGDNYPYEYWVVKTPDGWEYETEECNHRGGWLSFEPNSELEKEVIAKAYQHMQECRKTKTLEAFVRGLLSSEDYIWNTDLEHEVNELAKQFNITEQVG